MLWYNLLLFIYAKWLLGSVCVYVCVCVGACTCAYIFKIFSLLYIKILYEYIALYLTIFLLWTSLVALFYFTSSISFFLHLSGWHWLLNHTGSEHTTPWHTMCILHHVLTTHSLVSFCHHHLSPLCPFPPLPNALCLWPSPYCCLGLLPLSFVFFLNV